MSCEIQATVKFKRVALLSELILNDQNVRHPAAVMVMKIFSPFTHQK